MVCVEIILFRLPDCFHIMNLIITVDIWFKWRKIIEYIRTLKVIKTQKVTLLRNMHVCKHAPHSQEGEGQAELQGHGPAFQCFKWRRLQGSHASACQQALFCRPHTVLWPVCFYLPVFDHPPSIELGSLSIYLLSPQSSLSHLDSCCSSGVSHPPDLLLASEHTDPESLCPPRHYFLFLSLVGFGTVCAHFWVFNPCHQDVCVCEDQAWVRMGIEIFDQLQGCWAMQLFPHHCSEMTQEPKQHGTETAVASLSPNTTKKCIPNQHVLSLLCWAETLAATTWWIISFGICHLSGGVRGTTVNKQLTFHNLPLDYLAHLVPKVQAA